MVLCRSTACYTITVRSTLLGMNPLPAPQVPGNTEYERFHNAMRKIVSVPKEAVQKADAEWKAARGKLGASLNLAVYFSPPNRKQWHLDHAARNAFCTASGARCGSPADRHASVPPVLAYPVPMPKGIHAKPEACGESLLRHLEMTSNRLNVDVLRNVDAVSLSWPCPGQIVWPLPDPSECFSPPYSWPFFLSIVR